MVLDKIENYKLYTNLSARIAKALAYITKTDLVNVAEGKYEIDNDDVFALVQEYNTKDREECNLETHYKFIDVQYIISGVEQVGVGTLKNQIPIEKNDEKDYAFYNSDSDLIRFESGMFAIFFPNDLHKPGIKFNQSSTVKKVVIKVRI